MDGKSHEENIIPDMEKTRAVRSGIWKKDVKHGKSVAKETQGAKEQNIEITQARIKKRICKLGN